jgi:hypothetical protein
MKAAVKAVLSVIAGPLSYLAHLIRAKDLEASEAQRVQEIRAQRRLTMADAGLQVELNRQLDELQARVRGETPDSPTSRGFKVYSQADEDGIIEEILRRLDTVGTLSRTFIELGCGDGRENNTHYLALRGFRGCWCDASDTNIQYIERELGGGSFPRLRVTRQFLDRENAANYIEECGAFLGDLAPDLLSVDIDGNDLEIVRTALTVCRPKILCVEYNAKFPLPLSLSMTYNPKHAWSHDDYQGATLQAWCSALPDYMLVACSLSGVNAFFVRREYTSGFTEYPLHQLYQPPRHHLIWLSGSLHYPSLRWLRQVLRTT